MEHPELDSMQRYEDKAYEEDNIHLGSNFDDFYIEALQEDAKMLEQKLKDIECGECTKNMLDCKCEDT